MNYKYDSWNRVQSMTYPDGEIVSYAYNRGGMLNRVTGTKGAQNFVYVGNIAYNRYEKKAYVKYGNGTQTRYAYDILLRLDSLKSYTATGQAMQNIKYTYDNVSNITEIANTAGALSNGLGGSYDNQYTYDNLYRLTSSIGTWNGIGTPTCTYSLNMNYEQNGRIQLKQLTASTFIEGVNSQINYNNSYSYHTTQPNTLETVTDDNSGQIQHFVWDANGNMVYHLNEGTGLSRTLCWDEENRLSAVRDQKYGSYYVYDASGERTYKLTGRCQRQIVNGRPYSYCAMNTPTLYASPYVVCTNKGYTKHYYAEYERICSKIGGGELRNEPCIVSDAQFVEKKNLNFEHLNRVLECSGSENEIKTDVLKKPLYANQGSLMPEKALYFYHPDHLGSSSWITYTDGKAIEHLHYLPYGETQVDQRATSYATRYTFSAKEKDEETGYSYFGARYYNSDLSVWLSVDPMADKYPNMSPYVYCADNPVKLVDPDGEEFGDFYDYYGIKIGTDGKDDGRKYVVNNVGISDKERRETEKYIKDNSGNPEKFSDDCIAYKNSSEILGSSEQRTEMCRITEQDNGSGGTDPSRNREYGGKLVNGQIIEIEKGPVGDPSVDKTLDFLGEALFHTHASGTKGGEINIIEPQAQLNSGSISASWEQKPSDKDIDNSNSDTHYIFARGAGQVYLYNNTGTHVRMSHRAFKNIQ